MRAPAAIAVLTLLAFASALADDLALDDPASCAALQAPADPGGVRACLIERERVWGLEDPRLSPFLRAAAGAFAGDEDTAHMALPYRRRAFELSGRLSGGGAEAAQAALDYARSWLLTAQCTAVDPRVRPVIEAAAAGFAALPRGDAARPGGLRATALAYADGLAYAQAAATLEQIGAARGATDFMRIGQWRGRGGDLEAAAEAYRQALGLARDHFDRARIEESLRRLYFELGDLDALRALEAGQ